MEKINCDKYNDIDCEKYKYESIESKECNHCQSIIYLEEKLNINWKVLNLDDFMSFIYTKLRLEWVNVLEVEDKDILPMTLDLIWELIKEKKVKVQRYEIEEYEKPREEEIRFWTKFRKKVEQKFWYKILRLDPCKYKDNEKLKDDIEKWKIETLALYNYLLEKYGKSEADFLLDILEIVRSDCYEWEIKIE